MFYFRESETSHWYTVLKAPPRGFHDLEEFDESVYKSCAPQDASSLDIGDRDNADN